MSEEEAKMDEVEAVALDELEVYSVHQAVTAIKQTVKGLAKSQKSGGAGFKYDYRGRDAVVNHLSPLMAAYGVTVVPTEVKNVERIDVVDHNGKAEFLIQGVYVFTVFGPAGDAYDIEVLSMCQNSRDKAAGGFASYAYRYALEMLFALPTNDPDDDNEARNGANQSNSRSAQRPAPSGNAEPLAETIDEMQIQSIEALFNEVADVEEKKALKWAFVEEFKVKPSGLPVERYREAMAWLNAKAAGGEPVERGRSTAFEGLVDVLGQGDEIAAAIAEALKAKGGMWPLDTVPLTDQAEAAVIDVAMEARKAFLASKAKDDVDREVEAAKERLAAAGVESTTHHPDDEPIAKGQMPEDDDDGEPEAEEVEKPQRAKKPTKAENMAVLVKLVNDGGDEVKEALQTMELWPISKIATGKLPVAINIAKGLAKDE